MEEPKAGKSNASNKSVDIINALRPKFNMDDGADVAAWEYLNQINKIPVTTLIKDFVLDMGSELKQIEAEIESVEKQRVSSLNDKVLRLKCREILTTLRKERDGLREVIGRETYQRVVAGSGSGSVQSRY